MKMELPGGACLRDLQQKLSADHPSLSPLLSACRFSVNEEYADPGIRLADGAEIGVIPPVSGGAGDSWVAVHARIVRAPIDISSLAASVASASCGATLTFAGTVRADEASGRSVIQITYEGYDTMSEKVLRTIAGDMSRKHQVRVAVDHRLGSLKIGETSVGIAVACPHRTDGFAALREIIETIKRDMPIWKREEFSDGTSAWVQSGGHGPGVDLNESK